MKQISLRKFRDSIADLTEPVIVLRRSPDGDMAELGQWTPTVRHTDVGECWCSDCTHAALNPPHAEGVPYTGPRFNSVPFTPVPKKGK